MRLLHKKYLREKPQVRSQTLFRLYNEDRKKLVKKLLEDGVHMQAFLEAMCVEYVQGNPGITEIVNTKLKNPKKENPYIAARNNTPPLALNDQEAADLLKMLEAELPLGDKDIAR